MANYFTITIDDTGESYRCVDYRSALQGMEALGKKGIPVGCRSGGCGVCKVKWSQLFGQRSPKDKWTAAPMGYAASVCGRERK